MHYHLCTAVLALLPLALCDRSLATLNVLDTRVASPLDVAPAALSPSAPYFMLTSFKAFMPSSEHPELFSYSLFDLRLMHPDPARQWTTRCMTHTAGALCKPTEWTECMPVEPRKGNEEEKLRFKFSDDLTRIDIQRSWAFTTSNAPGRKGQTMYMRTLASEPTYWNENEKEQGGNVTVSEYGKLYERPAGWVFAWRQTVR